MATSSRKTALTALSEVTENEGYSNIVIDKAIRAAELSPRDAALASTIFYGVLEKRLTLDFYIRKFLAKPKQKLDGTVLNILRIAVYQMMYLDRVPDSAAVNEAVLCAAEYRRGQYKNFVNGVLRSFARGWHEVLIPEDDLSVRYNIPQPIIESFKKDYGETVCIDLLKAMSERAETYIRINPLKTTVDDLIQSLPENTAEKAVLQNALCVHGTGDVTGLPGFAEGKFTVQDASSALAVEAAGICPGNTVMDLCAAPGGKTILAAEFAGEAGHVVSRDISEYKTDLIRENLERMNRRNVEVQVYDATVHDPEKEKYADVVLMDVPCSGLGVMGKKRDIKYHATPESLQSITELQRQIVAAGWQYVKPHGVLLYSTCTIHRGENQEMAVWITENFPFVLEEERQLLPGTDETDGFYYARLRRKA